MNLCGEYVTHKVFGRGKISEQENDCVTVLFSETHGKKRFIYPSASGNIFDTGKQNNREANERK